MKFKSFLFRHKVLFGLSIVIVVWLVVYLLLIIIFRPSHDRDWELGHEQLPQFIFSNKDSEVTIENYRNFNWTDVKSADIEYQTRKFDYDAVSGVDVFISHFDDFEGLAHIFLSFTLEEDDPIVVSLETRREKGESFSPILGMLRQFEIIYVVGSEEDIVGLRTGYRDERVYLYQTKATAEQAKELLSLIIKGVNDIHDTPRMYNTLTRNCTNELTRPVEKMSTVTFPITWKSVLPGFFDEVLHELKLIETDGTFEEIKNRHLIDNTKVDENESDYSIQLRTKK
jgi:hypothetical protein